MDSKYGGLCKIVSGGQTGADRGALDAARAAGFAHGGWCPAGRRAEDGPIDAGYQLRATVEKSYEVRTEQNVLHSDGTLILCHGSPRGGTRLTCRLARRHSKPLLVIDLDQADAGASEAARWLDEHAIEVLNVAGPRESQSPGIRATVERFITQLIPRQ